METQIPLVSLERQNGPLREELRSAFDRVLASNSFILGAEVERFEKQVAAYLNVGHAVGVSSGTDALVAALMALDIGPGDEVVTSPFSFFATAGAISRVGGTPVFADIDPVTFNLDPAAIEGAITGRTKAIMPVHMFGQPADYEGINAVAAAHGLPTIEDAAQAIGASSQDGRVGSLGTLACFSFFPTKNLGCLGDGGLVTTNDSELASTLRQLRNHGASARDFHPRIGGNFRLDALQAAFLGVKLPHLDSFNDRRRQNAAIYDRAFAEANLPERVLSAPERVQSGHIYNQYVIRSEHRDGLRDHLAAAGIGSAVYYSQPIHQQACYRDLGYALGSLPHAERACREVLALPVSEAITDGEVERVASEVITFLSAHVPSRPTPRQKPTAAARAMR